MDQLVGDKRLDPVGFFLGGSHHLPTCPSFFSFRSFLFCFLCYPAPISNNNLFVQHNWLITIFEQEGRGFESFIHLFYDFFLSCTQPRQNTKKYLVKFTRDFFVFCLGRVQEIKKSQNMRKEDSKARP